MSIRDLPSRSSGCPVLGISPSKWSFKVEAVAAHHCSHLKEKAQDMVETAVTQLGLLFYSLRGSEICWL